MNDTKLDQILEAIRGIGFQYEDMRSQFQAVVESVSDMQQQVRHIPSMRDDIKDLKQDMHVMKLIARNLSRMVANHETRIGRLEHL